MSAHNRRRRVHVVRPGDSLSPEILESCPPLPPNLARIAGRLKGCLLCGGPCDFLDIFVPVSPAAALRRPVAFLVCRSCVQAPGFIDRVEQAARSPPSA